MSLPFVNRWPGFCTWMCFFVSDSLLKKPQKICYCSWAKVFLLDSQKWCCSDESSTEDFATCIVNVWLPAGFRFTWSYMCPLKWISELSYCSHIHSCIFTIYCSFLFLLSSFTLSSVSQINSSHWGQHWRTESSVSPCSHFCVCSPCVWISQPISVTSFPSSPCSPSPITNPGNFPAQCF